MVVEIDESSGFCFGVVNAIAAAEQELQEGESLYCLGDIVHNTQEVNRLKTLGLKIIDHADTQKFKTKKVLIRAHGEPPSTYHWIKKNDHLLVDATCPIVLRLQNKIKRAFEEIRHSDGQIVILGKEGHAEVIGLKGQVDGRVIVIKSEQDIEQVDLSKPVRFFAQTTQDPALFKRLKEAIEARMRSVSHDKRYIDFKAFDTICRQVANRAPELVKFSKKHDVIVFVSDEKSSNGKFLYITCKEANPCTYFVQSPEDVDLYWFKDDDSVGICGATSTPRWIMEDVRTKILQCKTLHV